MRDGLKPVQRRILWSMIESGLRPDRPHRKSVAAVGEVIEEVPPARRPVGLRRPGAHGPGLGHAGTRSIDGHGNFGSVDGDPPAAYRYTEARLAPMAMELLRDIDSETVDFVPNFDGYEQQPVVLPGRYPNLLVNGAAGIAVGMATNIPPHNLGEIIDATTHYLDNPEATTADLMKFVKAPDFPTGAHDHGPPGHQGRLRDRARLDQGARAWPPSRRARRTARNIVVTELPYQVNKARLAEKIAELVRTGKIKDIADVRDESNRQGMRLVIVCKRGANAAGGAEPALQADAAAGELQRDHAVARRRRSRARSRWRR